MPHSRHQHQEPQRESIQRPGHPRYEADVDQRNAQHQHEPEGEAQHMPRGIRFGRAAGRTVERRVADARKRTEQYHVEPAYAPDLAGQAEIRLPDQATAPNHAAAPRSAVLWPGASLRFAGSRFIARTMMSRAIGAAAAAPALPCSTTTASA